MKIEVTPAQKLRVLMAVYGIGGRALADRIGTSCSHLSLVLTREVKTSFDFLQGIAELTGIDRALLDEDLELAGVPPRRVRKRSGPKCVPTHVTADVRAYMDARGITTAELCRRLNGKVAVQTVYRYFREGRMMSIYCYCAICDALGVPHDYFCECEEAG